MPENDDGANASSSVSAEIKRLKNKRKYLRSSLTKFSNFLGTCKEATDVMDVENRLSRFENLLPEFIDTQLALDELENMDAGDEIYVFESEFYKALKTAKQFIQVNQSPSTCHVPTNSASTSHRDVRLPTIDLPVFNGDYEKWPAFRETFIALIGNNTRLTKVEKLYYLISVIKPPASNVIDSLELTNDNYDEAFKLLEERYDQRRVVINKHIQELFQIQPMFKENLLMLRQIVDDVNKHTKALAQLQQPVSEWDTLLVYLVSSKLDNYTRKAWEGTLSHTTLPTLKELLDFLVKKCNVLEAVTRTPSEKPRVVNVISVNNTKKCNFCDKDSHNIYTCETFLSLPVQKRIYQIKGKWLCLNCLKPNHVAKDCRGQRCKECNKSHNSLLHLQKIGVVAKDVDQSESHAHSANSEATDVECITASCVANYAHVFLPTAIVHVEGADGKTNPIRALLDTGSDSNFITKNVYKMLGLKNDSELQVSITGIGQSKTICSRTQAKIKVKSRYTDYKCERMFLVIENITAPIPPVSLPAKNVQLPPNLSLADENYNIRGDVDMLLGADVFFDALLNERIQLGKNNPVLQHSKFGWLITGRWSLPQVSQRTCNFAVQEFQDQIEKFWTIENVLDEDNQKNGHDECELSFTRNICRENDRHFTVSLPRKDIQIGKSGEIATRRFYAMERRLQKDENLRKQYVDFMREYLNLGHMELIKEVNNKSDIDEGPNIYYIPHHPVIKTSSSTTMLRVVFDASCKSSNGLSLNDILLVGPKTQDDLFTILLRFRTYNVVFVGDIEKMFRQVWVNEEDRDLQRILWREDVKEPVKIYRPKTVTYGTGPASFLFTRCLNQLAYDNKDKFPEASYMIKHSFYMDDLIAGSNDVESAIRLKNEIVNILSSCGFHLRKFASNSAELLLDCHRVEKAYHVIKNDEDNKTLGVLWDSKCDELKYDTNKVQERVKFTKRSLLSQIAKLFDPLGLIAPIVVRAKILMQKLWQTNTDWDSKLPEKILQEWEAITADLPKLNELRIRRYVMIENYVTIEIHGFCDSSEKAFGCAVYMRVCTKEQIAANLLCAKTRVAPLKKISLPRLELCAAELLSKLVKRVLSDLTVPISKVHYWTDSTIVLCWLRGSPHTWKTFVANRVSKITHYSSPAQRSHVSGNENPADMASRGVTLNAMIERRWLVGPESLIQLNLLYDVPTATNADAENERRHAHIAVATKRPYDIWELHSSSFELPRVVAYILRFRNNCDKRRQRKTGFLDRKEVSDATLCKLY